MMEIVSPSFGVATYRPDVSLALRPHPDYKKAGILFTVSERSHTRIGFTSLSQTLGSQKGISAMTTKTASRKSTTIFTSRELATFKVLRGRYRQEPEIFSSQELVQLRFLRWRFQHGDLAGCEEQEAA
jgi:hypothetical protein